MYSDEAIESKNWIFWLFLICIFVGEYYLFKQYVFSKIVGFFPRGYDQANFLTLIYRYYENIKALGWLKGVLETQSLATGLFFPIQIATFFKLVGASRWVALLVNFIYFILLQGFCLLTIRFITNKNYFLYLFFGMMLSIKAPFINAGGNLFDVRMDFTAFCLYGLFICAVIRSEFFLKRLWSILATIVAIFLIFMRTISMVYITGITFVMFGYFLLKKLKKNRFIKETNQRLSNLIFFSSLLGIAMIPILWIYRASLYNYYFLGHVINNEKNIRAAELGIKNNLELITYYPENLFSYHFGWLAVAIGCLFILSYFVVWLVNKNKSYVDMNLVSSNDNKAETLKVGFVFLLSALFIPLTALTFDGHKSPIVGGIMVLPLLWLLVWLAIYIDMNAYITKKSYKVLNLFALMCLFVGISSHVNSYRDLIIRDQSPTFANISKMYMDIGKYSQQKGWRETIIGFDKVTPFLTAGGINTLYYENTGKLLNVNVSRALGGSIFASNEQSIINSLKECKVLVLTLNGNDYQSAYPYNTSIQNYKSLITEYAEKYYLPLNDYKIGKSKYRVYVAKE